MRGHDSKTLPRTQGGQGRGTKAPKQETESGYPRLCSPSEQKESVFVLAMHALAYSWISKGIVVVYSRRARFAGNYVVVLNSN